MTDHVPTSASGEPTRQDPGYAVDPAGRPLTLPGATAPGPAATATTRRPGGPSRRAWRRIGLVVGLAVVANGAVQLGPVLGASEERQVAIPPDLSSLRIVGGSGDVVVRPVAVGQAGTAVARVRGWRVTGRLTLDGSTLRADDLCGPFPSDCTTRLEVSVPAGVDLVIDAGSGDVTVTDLTGPVSAESSSGDIELDRLTGSRVSAEASSGDVTLTDIRAGQVSAATSSGDVVVELDSDAESVRARATSGDVRVVVPAAETGYDTLAETSSGDVTNRVGDVPGAPRTIEARTSSGDVELLRR